MRSALPALRILFGVLVLAAMGRQLAIHIQMGASLVNFFSYFTNLSNLFAAVVFLVGAYRQFAGRGSSSSWDEIRAISVVNMVVVGVVFSVLLRNVDLGALLPWVNFVLHTLMPVVVVVDWLVQPSSTRLGGKHLLWCLVFPALYLTYVLVRGAGIGWYPYPFLDPARVAGYGAVAAYSAGIAITFLVAGWILIRLGNRQGTTAPPAV